MIYTRPHHQDKKHLFQIKNAEINQNLIGFMKFNNGIFIKLNTIQKQIKLLKESNKELNNRKGSVCKRVRIKDFKRIY